MEPSAPAGDEGNPGEYLALLAAAQDPSLPTSVGGEPITLSTHRGPKRKWYVRKHIVCRVPGHEQCSKFRNCNLTAEGDQRQVVAYLACWLEAGPLFESRTEHMAFKPSKAEVVAYL